MVARCSRSAALFAVVAGIAPVALTSGATAYASRAPALANLSGNAYFPLVVGATWTYRDVGGPAAGFTTLTIHVVSAHTTASGEAVNVQDSVGAHAFTEQYVIGPNGAIEVSLAAGSGATRTTVSGNSSYFIPSASMIGSCHPCHFAANFTSAVAGFTMHEHMTEAATSMGVEVVRVPAGTFRAEKLQMAMRMTSSGSPVTIDDNINYAVYLVSGVGLVETGAGSVRTSVMGHTTTAATGTEELVRYTP